MLNETSTRPGASVYAHCNISRTLNDMSKGAMTAQRLIRKSQQVDSGPVPENLHPSPQIGGIFPQLISLNRLPYKNWQPHTLRWLSSSDMAHNLSVEWASL